MKQIYSIFFLVSFLFISCNEQLVEAVDTSQNSSFDKSIKANNSSNEITSDGYLVLGRKLENPYSLINMEKAMKSLAIKNIKNEDVRITANYLYVRILPKNNEEYDLINNDETIDTFEYPLDYEILKPGNKYQDPSIGDDKFTWIYCAVPVHKKFNNKIEKEILGELFLPFGNGRDDSYSKSIKPDNNLFLELLEKESLTLTGNVQELKSGKLKSVDWYASGRIRVFDDLINYNDATGTFQQGSGYVPVPGCLVRANRWFTTKNDLTDNLGFFYINHNWPNGKYVNYSIKWDRSEFDIRSGSYGQAYFNGPNQGWQWQLNINEISNPDNYLYAHVHRGAHEYYYNHNTYGIQQPPTNNSSPLNGKMHLGAKQGNGRAHYFDINGTWFASEIKLPFNLSSDNSRVIFGTTIHELAHASHWDLGMTSAVYLANFNSSRKLSESWAQAVGWEITRNVYASVVEDLWLQFDSRQSLEIGDIQATYYTPLYIDLIDDFNQSASALGTNPNIPNDQANGYTIGQLEDFLASQPISWTNYRNHLINNNGSQNDNDATWLFNNYD